MLEYCYSHAVAIAMLVLGVVLFLFARGPGRRVGSESMEDYLALPSNIETGKATSCFMSGGKVYASGDFTLAGGIRAKVIKYDGEKWVVCVPYASALAFLRDGKWVEAY